MQGHTNAVRQALILIAEIVVMLLVLPAAGGLPRSTAMSCFSSAGAAAAIASAAASVVGAYATRGQRGDAPTGHFGVADGPDGGRGKRALEAIACHEQNNPDQKPDRGLRVIYEVCTLSRPD
jgi:hypothetical protein